MATEYRYPQPKPKYWDKEDERIYHGLKVCHDSPQLNSLSGTYRWVCKTESFQESAEFRYESDPEVERKRFPGYPGFFTISFPDGEEPTLENLTGKFRFFDIEGTFTGVKISRETMPNLWKIKEMKWAPGFSTKATHHIVQGHTLDASHLLDDNGNRFITFVWDQGYSGCAPHYAHWVGKKQADENALVGLSDAEREQMGMYITKEEVEGNANDQTKEEDDQTEEEDDQMEEEDDQTKEEDNIGSGESSGKRKVEEDDRDVKRKREE